MEQVKYVIKTVTPTTIKTFTKLPRRGENWKKAQLTELWASISNENFYFIQQMIKQISPA